MVVKMDQKHTKRRVGRPAGSGMINDTPQLICVAERLIDNPKKKPTTAMREVLRTLPSTTAEGDRTILRRWQARWKIGSAGYFEKAREKRHPKITTYGSPAGGYYPGLRATDRFLDMFRQVDAYTEAIRRIDKFPKLRDAYRMLAIQNAGMATVDSLAYRAVQERELFWRIREQREMVERWFPIGFGN